MPKNTAKENRGDTIRTCDLLVPNQTLCQAELRPDKQFSDDVGTPVEDVRVREGERLANVSVSRKSTWEFLATEFFQ